MPILCGPSNPKLWLGRKGDLRCVLYGHPENSSQGSAGATLLKLVQRAKLVPAPRAWDLLSLALAVVFADTVKQRGESPDGWTRQIALKVAVSDPNFWNAHRELLEDQLRFLTTDIWQLEFTDLGLLPKPPKSPVFPNEDCVTLLSGGLDSFIGATDLVAEGKKPYAVSQVSAGSKHSQSYFASKLGDGLSHLQLNHNVNWSGDHDRSQRARSIIFLAYGVLVATALKRYKDDQNITLYMCENGLISINPPLTPTRLGSLSTRTTHPTFLSMFQELLDAAKLNVTVKNPYQFRTKGEMLTDCRDQAFLAKHAVVTTSCGRYARNGWVHCGRCLPCLIRRAAIRAWGEPDRTAYVYDDLSKNDSRHARFDDVRCAAMAAALVEADGLDALPSINLDALRMGDLAPYRDLLTRGIKEVGDFLSAVGVK